MKPEPPGYRQANNIAAATPESIALAAKLLADGQLVGLPTETVYGLAASAFNPAALARIFEVKRRPLYDPLILHASTAQLAWALASEVPDAAHRCAERFWPGPLTLVLRKHDVVPDLATSGLPHVALRVPSPPRRAGAAERIQRAARRTERQPLWSHQPH